MCLLPYIAIRLVSRACALSGSSGPPAPLVDETLDITPAIVGMMSSCISTMLLPPAAPEATTFINGKSKLGGRGL
ncbi:hypothetical protein BJ912DRAFT_1062352 [Pholiota molesta]|nr:hypothetical protein BJ912DRAFT_1062352 [Pholiota molesta]